MATNSLSNFDLPKKGYAAFDALSLRQLIIDRLNDQKTFTDQTYLGSNLAAIIDIVAYSYHTLIYYLNKTATESMFTEAQLYENINRIVKLIDYSPVGFQTSTLSFVCSALGQTTTTRGLQANLYTIPRYSYVIAGNGSIPFSFNEDITFNKTINGNEALTELSQQKLLYQGYYVEHPLFTATGEDKEMFIVNPGDDLVDHFNIDVYVKPALTGKWEQYTKTTNLYLEDGSAKKYEIRLNGNNRYEIQFGNDINGKKLFAGDQIAVYYLGSKGVDGEIGPNGLAVSRLVRFNTLQYNSIINDVLSNQLNLLTNDRMNAIIFNNDNSSTPIKYAESVEEVRKTAPATYRSQYRLVTTRDYESYLRTNFTNLLADVKVVNNWDYVSGYLKYFYDLGLTSPAQTERALYNQLLYSDSCNFNNIYFLVVPRAASTNFDYLLPAQKELISSSLLNVKMATTENVFIDPVYKAISFGVASTTIPDELYTDRPTNFVPYLLTNFNPVMDESICELQVIKRTSSRRDNQSIANDIANLFVNYFNRENLTLGQTIDVRQLTQDILSVDGVETFYTVRNGDEYAKVEGLSLFVWNPIYPDSDKQVIANNLPLRYFEYPFFNNISTITNKIKVISVSTVYEQIEY